MSEKKLLPQNSLMSDNFSDLLIATRNAGKLRELRQFFADLPLRLLSLAEFPSVEDVEETGSTFEENAALKAQAYASQTKLWTLADDSGLEVEALGGTPGIFSARYAGEKASDAARAYKLLSELSQTQDIARRARFVCVIALSNPAAEIVKLAKGVCEGRIADAPRGENGFGYDPVFIPDGFTETFGELPTEIKQQISHRARALTELRSFLRQQFFPQT